MAYLDHDTHEINLKIVCFVPATTLRAWRRLYVAVPAYLRGELHNRRLPTGTVIAYDFASELGKIRGYAVRLHVFAGAVTGEEDLRLLGEGADAAVVVDGDADELVAAGHLGAQVPVQKGGSADAVEPLLKEATRNALRELKKSTSDGDEAPRDDPRSADEPARQVDEPARQVDEPARQADGSGRQLDVGPYRFAIPVLFPEAHCVDEPPLHRLDGVFADQVSLTLAVVLGHGASAELRGIVESASSAWGGSLKPASLTIEGIAFEGVRGNECDGFDPPARAAESYAGTCGGDLMVFTILYGGDGTADLALRRRFLSMIREAIAGRMKDPRSAR